MNRSLVNVILGGFGNRSSQNNEMKSLIAYGTHTETNIDHVADLMTSSKNIIITPGKMNKNKKQGGI